MINILKLEICLTITNKSNYYAEILPSLFWLKNYIYNKQTPGYLNIDYVIKLRTLYNSTEVNWLKIGDVTQGPWLDQLVFSV